jgi:hypothetical protein
VYGIYMHDISLGVAKHLAHCDSIDENAKKWYNSTSGDRAGNSKAKEGRC